MGNESSSTPYKSGIRDVLLGPIEDSINKADSLTRMIVSVIVDILATFSMSIVLLNTLYQEKLPNGYLGHLVHYSRKIPNELYILFAFLTLPLQTQLFNNGIMYVILGLVCFFCGFYGNSGWLMWMTGAVIGLFGLIKTGLVSEEKLKFILGMFEYTSIFVVGAMIIGLFFSNNSSINSIMPILNSKGSDETNKLLFS